METNPNLLLFMWMILILHLMYENIRAALIMNFFILVFCSEFCITMFFCPMVVASMKKDFRVVVIIVFLPRTIFEKLLKTGLKVDINYIRTKLKKS